MNNPNSPENITSVYLKSGQTMFGYNGEFILEALKADREFYEAVMLEAWFTVHPFRTVYDIGANIGNHSVYFACNAPQAEIFAFEPMPVNFPLLQANIEVNKLQDKRINLINKAVGKESGYVHMQLHKDDYFYANSNAYVAEAEEEGSVKVEIVAIDDLDLPIPDFVKIDTEGHEINVLKGMEKTLRESNALVWIEIHHGNETEVFEIMDRLGFEILDLWIGTSMVNMLFGKKGQGYFPKSHLMERLFYWNSQFFAYRCMALNFEVELKAVKAQNAEMNE